MRQKFNQVLPDVPVLEDLVEISTIATIPNSLSPLVSKIYLPLI